MTYAIILSRVRGSLPGGQIAFIATAEGSYNLQIGI